MTLQEHFPPIAEGVHRVCPRCGTRNPRGEKKVLCSTCVHLCSRCKNLRAPGKRLCHSCASQSMRAARAEEISIEHKVRALEIRSVRLEAELQLTRQRLDKAMAQIESMEKLFVSTPANLARA